jgi:hypothetical protein
MNTYVIAFVNFDGELNHKISQSEKNEVQVALEFLNSLDWDLSQAEDSTTIEGIEEFCASCDCSISIIKMP